MAARFHSPHPRPLRRRRSGLPPLALVPPALAPVLPMPRPGARPALLVVLSCPLCDLADDPMPAARAEQSAGAHDDEHHGGRPTAELHTVHVLAPHHAPDPTPAFVLVEECAELLRRPWPDADTAEAQRITATLTAVLAAGRAAVLVAGPPAADRQGSGPDLGGVA